MVEIPSLKDGQIGTSLEVALRTIIIDGQPITVLAVQAGGNNEEERKRLNEGEHFGIWAVMPK